MFWFERAGLLLSCYCLVAVIDGSRAESSQGPLVSLTTRDQTEGFLMLAAAVSGAPRSETSDATISGAGERQEQKPSPPPTAAPAKSSSLSSPAGGSSRATAPTLAAADKPASPVGPPADKAEPLPAKAPSLIERLEGREGDAMIWLTIAAAFFLVGWISGSIHTRRRERSRRTRLRF